MVGVLRALFPLPPHPRPASRGGEGEEGEAHWLFGPRRVERPFLVSVSEEVSERRRLYPRSRATNTAGLLI